MSVTQIPPRDPLPPPTAEQPDLFEAQHWETAYRRFNPDDVPHLLIQMQDDLSRSRKREALWLSVVLHLLVIILLWNSTRLVQLWPWHKVYVAAIDANVQKDATYLALPPDEQKLTKRPDAKVISDKDRIATSKTPRLDRDELKKILDASRAGRPGLPAAPQQAPAVAQNQPPPSPQENPQEPPNSGFSPPAQTNPAQLQAPPQGRRTQPSFTTPQSAGSAIEQATQAAAANRGRYGAGEGGDYGLNQPNGAKMLDQMEVLTDTLGVDFGPYLARVLQEVKGNWYRLIPPSAMPPIMKKGKLSIQFLILKDGKVSNMQLVATSNDTALDRAAWGGITASNPFPPLPREFLERAAQQNSDRFIGLRFNFYYNPDKSDLQ
jgi:outer membrane biosynthesis protein TonB